MVIYFGYSMKHSRLESASDSRARPGRRHRLTVRRRRRLDGVATAAAIRAELDSARRARSRRRAGRAAGARTSCWSATTRPRRSTSATRTGGRRDRPDGDRPPAAGVGDRRRGARRSSTRSTPTRPATASSCSRRCRPRSARPRRSRSSTRSIPPRTSTASIRNVGLLVQGRADARAVHAVGRDRAARARGHADRRPPRRRASAAARSSASRWRCCCCSATRP